MKNRIVAKEANKLFFMAFNFNHKNSSQIYLIVKNKLSQATGGCLYNVGGITKNRY